MRIDKQRTIKVNPFAAHFGRQPHTVLGNVTTSHQSSN